MSRVFISYSHDCEEHRERVLALSRRLLAAGHQVILDRFTAHPEPNWPQWMARELLAADVVLCVCTPTYRARFEGTAPSGGFGVAWEGHLITTELYRAKGRAGRFVPVQGGDAEAIPVTLRGQAPLAFGEDDAILAALGGVVGPPIVEPEVHAGWTAAMTVGALVGPIWKPLRQPRGGEGYAPTQLLRAEHAVVPFLGREDLVDDLDEWCAGGGVRVRLVYGPGGAGKTRLALEIAARRCKQGWRAGPLVVWSDVEAPNEYLDALLWDKIPLFLIVDYAETRHELLIRLLRRLADVGGCSARVLLIARGKGDWWSRVHAQVPEFYRMSSGSPDLRLDGIEGGAEHARAAAAVFAEWVGRPVHRAPRDHGRTALDRQVEALVAVLGGGPLEGVEQLLRHEDHFLLTAGPLAGITGALGRLLPRLMAQFTLAGGVASDELPGWTRQVKGFARISEAEGEAIWGLLNALYPRAGGGIDGVRPDRVGEALVEREDGDGELARNAARSGRAHSMLTVLTRLARRTSMKPLNRILHHERPRIVLDAVRVALETGAPMGQALSRSFVREPDPDLAWSVSTEIPIQTIELRDFAVHVTTQAAAQARRGGFSGVRVSNLANRLLDAGKPVEAWALLERLLVSSDDGLAAPNEIGDVAASDLLTNASNTLSRLGRAAEATALARQAVGIDRTACERGTLDAGRRLSSSLNNLSIRLHEQGDDEEAIELVEEAISMRRSPADGVPGDLARSLNNLACFAGGAGPHAAKGISAATEAVALRRVIAAASLDAFLPDLATALHNLADCLQDAGSPAQAFPAIEEAIEIRRHLALRHSQAFATRLGDSINVSANILASLRRWDEALERSAEAVALLRTMACAGDVLATQHLCVCLTASALININSGNPRRAVSLTEECLATFARLRSEGIRIPNVEIEDVRRFYVIACTRSGTPVASWL